MRPCTRMEKTGVSSRFFPLSYRMTEQFGPFDPDPTRPLRSEPVRREEVLIEVKQRGWPAEKWHLLTMPIATWQLVAEEVRSVLFGREVNYVSRHLVGAPALWQSLLAEPQARWSVGMDYSDYYKALNPREAGPVPEFLPSSRPGLFGPGIAAEYVCIWCGVRYLARESDGRRSRLCSNRCQELRHSALTKASRERRPRPDYAVI